MFNKESTLRPTNLMLNDPYALFDEVGWKNG